MSHSRMLRLAPALALVAALGALGACGGADDSAGESESATESVTFEIPAAAPGRCMMPSAELLAGLEQPFRGTLEKVEGGTATFTVSQHFDDSSFETATLTAPDAPLLEGAMPLQVGADYLITSQGGVVSMCGLSGEATPDLEALYREAFAD